jgi:hypothetical protein
MLPGAKFPFTSFEAQLKKRLKRSDPMKRSDQRSVPID